MKVECKERMESDGLGMISVRKVDVSTCIFHFKCNIVNGPEFYQRIRDLCEFMGEAPSFRTVA